MGMQTRYEIQSEFNDEWFNALSGDQAEEAKKGLDAGMTWAMDGKPFDTIKAVALYYRIDNVVIEPLDGDRDELDLEIVLAHDQRAVDHDAEFYRCYDAVREAVGEDDKVFNEAVAERDWRDPFYHGFMRGVCQVFEDMAPATEHEAVH